MPGLLISTLPYKNLIQIPSLSPGNNNSRLQTSLRTSQPYSASDRSVNCLLQPLFISWRTLLLTHLLYGLLPSSPASGQLLYI
jgi:hypothetical protein